jgi:predicted nucleotidyltransferase
MSPHISIDRSAHSALCQRHHIVRLSVFGSVLRDDFRPDSDVDVLVEFEPGHVPDRAPKPSMSPRDVVYVGHMLDMARKAVDKTTGRVCEAASNEQTFLVRDPRPRVGPSQR